MIADKCILLVDADDSNRTSMEYYFRRKTRVFKSVPTAEMALDLMATDSRWDAVISDYKLPGMDGICFLKQVKTRLPQVKTALITAYASMDVVTDALRAGIHDFIQKPLKAAMISDALERMTARPAVDEGEVNLYADGDAGTRDEGWREDLEFTIQKVTHQMNNALTALRGKAELGQCKSQRPEEGERFADILGILSSVEALNKELMSFGKALTRRPFIAMDVLALIRQRTAAHADLIKGAGVELSIRDADQASLEVSTCEEPLVHILDNILINAVQGVAGVAERRKQISVAAEQGSHTILVKVADNGVGMSPETLEKACSSGFTTKRDGNGLGLFITNRLCQVIKASMRMDSREGQGTTVTLSLPRAGNDQARRLGK